MSTPSLPPRYTFESPLGRGAVGEVYRAWDTRLECSVALKVTQPAVAAQPRFRRLFAREIRLAARLVHPRIVPLHDAGIAPDGTPFLCMALADAGSFARFRRDPPPWPELLRLTLEVLEALAFVHAQGVIHRDLKPENILLYRGPDGRAHAWLADLGAANLAEDMPKEEEIGGTPMYIAPEHAAGDVGLIGKASDLYALVAILKEFLSGRPPFAGTTFEELLAAKDVSQPPWHPRPGYEVPEGLVQVLNRQLEPHPLDRYDLAADLARALVAVSGLPDGAPRWATVEAPAPRLGDGPRDLWASSALRTLPVAAPDRDSGAREVLRESLRPAPDVPRWLKQLPPPLPAHPPPEPSLDAAGKASAALFLYRRPGLVGRVALRQRLWDLARRVNEERTLQIAVLVGEAGVGKTRLVESLASHLEEGGFMERLELRHQDPPGPTDGLLGALVRDLRPEAGSRMPVADRALDRLARWRGQLTDKERRDASLLARRAQPAKEGARASRVADVRWYLYEWLEAHGWRGGVLLVLEDAQWAEDEGGLAYAEALLRSQGTLPIPALVIATVRSESLAEDPALAARCETLWRAGAHRIDVPPMNEGEIEEVLQEYLTLEPSFARQLAQRCDGNPLFAHQLIDAWLQSRTLIDLGSLKYGLAGGVDIDAALPSSTEALLRERVDAIVRRSPRPDALRRALHLAALAGTEGPLSLLDAVLGEPWTRELMGSAQVLHQEQELYRFQHGLVREALLREAEARPDAAELHLALARGWLTLEAGSGKPTGLRVADHLLRGGKPAEALSRCLVAAQVAERGGQVSQMRQAADLALDATLAAGLAADDQRVVAARRFVALAREQRGELAEAYDLHRDLLDQARLKGTPRLEELHLRDLGRVLRAQGKLDRADHEVGLALDLARHRADLAAQAACLRGLADSARLRGDVGRARELLDEAVDLSTRASDREGLAGALIDLARAALTPGQDLQREEALLRRALKLAEELEDDRLIGECQRTWAELVKARGDLVTARMRYARCARFFAERGLTEPTVQALLNMALIELTLRRPEEAQVFVADARRWLGAAPSHWLHPVASLYDAVGWAQRGELDAAAREFAAARGQGLGNIVEVDLAAPLDQLATIAARSGSPDLAREAGRMARELWSRLGEEGEASRLEKRLAKLTERDRSRPPTRRKPTPAS